MPRALSAILAIVGVVVAVLAFLNSGLVIALFAYSVDGADADCDSGYTLKDAECRDRTGGIGIFDGCWGVLGAAAIVALWLLPLFVPQMQNLIAVLVVKGIIIAVSVIAVVFSIVAWALMAKDIDDYQDAIGDFCDTPGGWSAALAFALFNSILWIIMLIVAIIALVIEGFVSPASSE